MNNLWHEKLQRLDDAIRPIATRPIAFEDLETVLNDPDPLHPLDDAGVRAASEALMLELLHAYACGTDDERRQLRGLVPRYEHFFWAATYPAADSVDERLRLWLLQFALVDQYPDPRDAVVSLDGLCKSTGLPQPLLDATLNEVAQLASGEDRYGFGSTRSMLLERISKPFGTRRTRD